MSNMGITSLNIRRSFVVLTLTCLLLPFVFPGLWKVLIGEAHLGVLFLDTFAILSAADANAVGIDVFRFNPLDLLHRPHVYSSWWLLISHLGISRVHFLVVGACVSLLFVVAVLLIIIPRNYREFFIAFLCIYSPAALLAVERANNDLIIFCLLALTPVLINREDKTGLVGSWLIIFLSMGLKFYPVLCFLLILATSRSKRLKFWYIFSGCAATAVYLIHYLATFMLLRHTIPAPEYLLTIGGKLLFVHLGMPNRLAMLLTIIGFLLVLACSCLWSRKQHCAGLCSLDSTGLEYFVLGSCVLLFCYFATSNYEYREIFFILLLPFLFEKYRNKDIPAPVHNIIALQMYLIPLLMWSETLGRIGRYVYYMIFNTAPGLFWYFILKDSLSWIVFSLLLCTCYCLYSNRPAVSRETPPL